MATRHVFTDRTEANRFADQARASGSFVRFSERQTRVTNRVAASAAAGRNRYVFTVTTNP